MDRIITSEDCARLQEIKEEMKDLLSEAKQILRNAPRHVQDRASAYWMGHIATSLDKDHGYVGDSMCSFEDTINEVWVDEDSEDDEDLVECEHCNKKIRDIPGACPNCGFDPLSKEDDPEDISDVWHPDDNEDENKKGE